MTKSCEILKIYKKEKEKKFSKIYTLLKKFAKEKELKLLRGFNNFNYINLLKGYSDEVTHSRIIAEFLNPFGSHYQKTLFLKLFFETVGLKNYSVEKWEVYTEYSTKQNRRIDILLKHEKHGYLIIENKIYADDQNRQIHDYIENFIDEKKPIKVFYLTLYKRSPNKDSLGDFKIENNKIFNKNHEVIADYKNITYEDILKWLEFSKKEVENICSLKEALYQYIKTVRKILNKEEDIMNLKDFLLKDENKEYLIDLIENQNEIINKADGECKKIIEEENLPTVLENIKLEIRKNIAKNIKDYLKDYLANKIFFDSEFGDTSKMNYIIFEFSNNTYILFFENQNLFNLKIGKKTKNECGKNIEETYSLLKKTSPWHVLRVLKCFEEKLINDFGKNNIDFYIKFLKTSENNKLINEINENIISFIKGSK
jgi:hypothetical protein